MFLGATKREVRKNVANKKLGRPTDNPKTFMLRVKMDKDSIFQLDECCKVMNMNRSEFVRDMIHKKFGELKK